MKYENTNVISGSGNRENPRVELDIDCYINKQKHITNNISSGGISCKKIAGHIYNKDESIDVNLAFDANGFYVFFKDKATIVGQTEDSIMIEFSGENKKGIKLLESVIDSHLTGDMDRNKVLVSGLLGMNQKDVEKKKTKKTYLSILISTFLFLIAIFVIYKNVSTINVEYSTVSKEVYALESPTNGKVFPKIKEGDNIPLNGLAFTIEEDDDGSTLLGYNSKISVLKKELELKENEYKDSISVLNNHLNSLEQEDAHLVKQINRLKSEISNRRKTYLAYKESSSKGYSSQTKYLEEYNQYLTLNRTIEEKRGLRVKIQADLINAKNGLYSKNAIFEESFVSPKKIEREIELLKAEISSINESISGIGSGIVELFSNRNGYIEKMLAEEGNGVVNGQDLALVSHINSKKYIVSVIESRRTDMVSKNNTAKITIDDKEYEGKIIDIKHSYDQVDFATNGNRFYGLDGLKKPENSFVFIEVEQEILKDISIGTPIEVKIDAGILNWII